MVLILPRIFYPATFALLLSACAAPPLILPKTPDFPADTAAQAPVPTAWSGRLGVVLERDFSEQNQSFHAHFTLRGNAQAGELAVFAPLGGTQLAALSWGAAEAVLLREGQREHAASVDALAARLLGAQVPPLAALLDWLAGRATAVEGWSIDFDNHTAGRVRAQRSLDGQTVYLRMVAQPLP